MTDRASGLVSYLASGVAIVAGLTLNDWAALVGIGCALATAAVNAYYKRRVAHAVTRTFCKSCPLKE